MKINIPVEKIWDVKDASKIKDLVVEIKLLENGRFNGKTLILNKDNNWKAEFKELLIRDSLGLEIKYDVEEISIPGFYMTKSGNKQEGFKVTNSDKPVTPPETPPETPPVTPPVSPENDRVNVRVEKKWETNTGKKVKILDLEDPVTIRLYADDVEIDKVVMTGSNWKHEFKNLPKYTKGNTRLIKYTVKEDSYEDFNSTVTGNVKEGFTVTNRMDENPGKPYKIVEYVEFPVEKIWEGKAEKSATVILLADGKEVETVVLDESNGWSYMFTDHPKYDKNTEELINYTIKETPVDGYITTVEGNVDDGFKVTNKYVEKPVLPVNPVKPNPPTKTDNPQTYKEGIEKVLVATGVGLVLLMAAEVIRRKQK